MNYSSSVSDESGLITEFNKYINKKERPWMYKLLCIYGIKKFFRFRLDKKCLTHLEIEYREVHDDIVRFVRKWRNSNETFRVLRTHCIRDMYLQN
jgi:hypothetical protein